MCSDKHVGIDTFFIQVILGFINQVKKSKLKSQKG